MDDRTEKGKQTDLFYRGQIVFLILCPQILDAYENID
jgi:hypothetical protein